MPKRFYHVEENPEGFYQVVRSTEGTSATKVVERYRSEYIAALAAMSLQSLANADDQKRADT